MSELCGDASVRDFRGRGVTRSTNKKDMVDKK